jgi:hypothetical protein
LNATVASGENGVRQTKRFSGDLLAPNVSQHLFSVSLPPRVVVIEVDPQDPDRVGKPEVALRIEAVLSFRFVACSTGVATATG